MIRQQFTRYVMIGVLLNAALYGSYLLLTHTVMGSRAAMSITYCVGVLIGFLLNRKITFSFHGGDTGALFRYIVSYAVGYGVNLLGLWLFVDFAGFPHELVQGGMIITLAFMLFALQKWWVFGERQTQRGPVSFPS
jgi:putative flippase GtrA